MPLQLFMGNIKQESKFIPNICEGGARVNYEDCHVGGYGLIQWTSIGRYQNLGKFATKYECDPSTLQCQTRYMINENVIPDVICLSLKAEDELSISTWILPTIGWDGASKATENCMPMITLKK